MNRLATGVRFGVASLCFVLGCHAPHEGDGVDGATIPDASAVSYDFSQSANLDAGDLRGRVDNNCPQSSPTTLTGKVYAPNGSLPLYNAVVFVPNQAVTAFTAGVSCDACSSVVSGDPITTALTGPDGSFELKGVPGGSDVPLVVQLGHWRREVILPNVIQNCASTAIDASYTRLPKNKSEGDIPHMAIATGQADPLECLLLNIGLDAAEITPPSGDGRIHFYQATNSPGLNLPDAGAPSAVELYPNLKSYDAVLLPCEGGDFDKGVVAGYDLGATDPRAQIVDYLAAGGRVFSTHLSYDWLTYKNSPYNQVAAPVAASGLWPVGQPDEYAQTIDAGIVTSFPKGEAFAEWLVAAGSTATLGHLDIIQGRHDLTGVNPDLGQAWVKYNFSAVDGGEGVMHATFNTPLDPPKNDMGQRQYCGRVVFSDFHTSAGDLVAGKNPFPTACKQQTTLSDQEKALAFMLFDLTSCVQPDNQQPIQ
jgi:hypothetical protein